MIGPEKELQPAVAEVLVASAAKTRTATPTASVTAINPPTANRYLRKIPLILSDTNDELVHPSHCSGTRKESVDEGAVDNQMDNPVNCPTYPQCR